MKHTPMTDPKIRHLIHTSVALTREQKEALLADLPTLTDTQLGRLYRALHRADEQKRKRLIQRFKQQPDTAHDYKSSYKSLRRHTLKVAERRSKAQEDPTAVLSRIAAL